LRVSPLRAAISCEIKGIDERRFHGADDCDEIVNNALMEIATGQSLCLQRLEWNDEVALLQSVACGVTTALMNLTTAKVEEYNRSVVNTG
jgi:hypothetical protein